MRYLLHKERAFEQRLRLQFLFDVFRVWFVPLGAEEDFIVFQSFPFSTWEPDILLMYGHNSEIVSYLKKARSPECQIYIISCLDAFSTRISIPGKYLYFDAKSEHTTVLLRGFDFGFEFDVTDAELNLYNSKLLTAKEKLDSVFYLSSPVCKRKEERTWTNSLKSSHLTISSISLFLEQFIASCARNCTE